MGKIEYVLIFLASVCIAAISQILLKRAAIREHKTKIAEYMNPPVIIAYILFFASSLMTVFAYKGVPLALGPILESTGYIFVAILSVIILKEKSTPKKIIGNILIIAGVIIATFL